jgi:outer membrane protein OmpA-like peptidoglycan-associated protein
MERKRQTLEAAARGSGIAVLRTQDDQLRINVPSDFSFDSDSAVIKPGMRPVLDALAVDLEAAELSRMLILVIGHTDDRGSDAVNDPLSLARARSVASYLESKGIAALRIAVEGHGEHEPMIGNDQAYGRALNRRVDVFLREPGA